MQVKGLAKKSMILTFLVSLLLVLYISPKLFNQNHQLAELMNIRTFTEVLASCTGTMTYNCHYADHTSRSICEDDQCCVWAIPTSHCNPRLCSALTDGNCVTCAGCYVVSTTSTTTTSTSTTSSTSTTTTIDSCNPPNNQEWKLNCSLNCSFVNTRINVTNFILNNTSSLWGLITFKGVNFTMTNLTFVASKCQIYLNFSNSAYFYVRKG